MARISRVAVLVLIFTAASQALAVSKTQDRETRRAEDWDGRSAGMEASSTVRNTSSPREKEQGAPTSVDGSAGVQPGTEAEQTRPESTVSPTQPTGKTREVTCDRGRCRETGRRRRCPRRRQRVGPPVVHLYMRYLTWRSNWQPGGRKWREKALRNSTVYQVLPWKVSWRRGVGNFKFKVNCIVPKDDIVRESELVLSYGTSFQSAVRKGVLQPPYRLVLLKVVRRAGVRKHRHVSSKMVHGNETSPWMIFNISRVVRSWRASNRLKHGLRLSIVSMATGLQVDQRVTKRLFNTTREATLLAAYVQEGIEHDRSVFSGRAISRMGPEGKDVKTRPGSRYSHGKSHGKYRDALQQVLLRNDTRHDLAAADRLQGPELLRDWLAFRGRQRPYQPPRRPDNSTDSRQENRDRRQVGDCRRQDHHIVFNDIILPEFILQPPRYNAYRCAGNCGRPFPNHVNATNHAMLMALLHEKDPGAAPAPCCVPLAYSAISVIEKHGSDVMVKPYPNMRVETCGCR